MTVSVLLKLDECFILFNVSDKCVIVHVNLHSLLDFHEGNYFKNLVVTIITLML